MIDFLKTRALSFRYAFGGWWYVIRTQRNAWIHAIVSISVIAIALWLGLNRYDWALITIAITMVWTAEFINTALEAIIDLASPEHHELARISKDVGASAVLIAAGSAAIIGFIILGPPLWERLNLIFL
ncbi:MAG: diacylglycerol kinase family protein [Anaerolineales bacterium]|nr:diacylglycerol kinase family protein [Anaerolineales bacterium]